MCGKWSFIILLFTLSANCFTQNVNIDSLKQVWEDSEKPDAIRLKSLKQISWDGFLYSHPDSAFYYAQIQYDFAKKKGLKKQIADAINTQGVSLAIKGDYERSINYFIKSLEIREEIGDQKAISASHNNLANLYQDQGNFGKAINHYTQSVRIVEKLDEKGAIADGLYNIGRLYFNQQEFDKSLDYHSRSLGMMKAIGNKKGIANNLNSIGSVYFERSEFTKSLNHFTNVLKIMKEIGDDAGVAGVLINIGGVYSLQGNYTKAIEKYNHGLNIMVDIGYKRGVVESLNSLGFVYYQLGESAYNQRDVKLSLKMYKESIVFSTRALVLAKQIGYVNLIKEASKNLYKSYKYLGNTNSSLKMHELYILMRDSMESIENQREILRLEFQYIYEMQVLADSISFVKQQEMDSLVYENDREKERYGLFGIFFFLLILISVYYRVKYIKNQAEKRELFQEIKLLKSEAVSSVVSSVLAVEPVGLDKERIEVAINASLNKSDWNILNELYKNPAISNKEIAELVSLSVQGAVSSLRKMYRLFEIKTARNQRVALVIKATRISSNSL